MLEKLSDDAVEPDQLAQLHDIGLSKPLRPAQGPGEAEVEWWKLGAWCWGVPSRSRAHRAAPIEPIEGRNTPFSAFSAE